MRETFVPSEPVTDGMTRFLTPAGEAGFDLAEPVQVVSVRGVGQALGAVAQQVALEYLLHRATLGRYRVRKVYTDDGTRWQVRREDGALVAGSFDADTALTVCGALNMAA